MQPLQSCLIETKTTTEDMKMFCFVLPVSACEQSVREIQQNIELDMLSFPSTHGQYEQ